MYRERAGTERPARTSLGIDKARELLSVIFNHLLPQYGYAVREEQVSLAEHIFEAIYNRDVTLAEAEVGTGKTLAYLVPAIIAKRGRLNDARNTSLYPKMQYAHMSKMPIVIATSSIALQKAIVTEYIPALSKILIESGVTERPLTAVLRKGREHYVCAKKLKNTLLFETDKRKKAVLAKISSIDLADTDGLDAFTKRKISVPKRCDLNCPHRESCAYLRFRTRANDPNTDIQVVNHNYLLADSLTRDTSDTPLIPNYQILIIDEAHKLLSAARTMYGAELSGATLNDIKDRVFELNFKSEPSRKLARKTAKKLHDEGARLFKLLPASEDDEAARTTANVTDGAARHLRNLRDISERLIDLLQTAQLPGNGEDKKRQILWDLTAAHGNLTTLAKREDNIYWLEDEALRAIPKDLCEKLFADQWSRGIPTILTSGTLSVNGDFTRIKQTLGLDKLGAKVTETSKPSPFKHRDNALLYISEDMPIPDNSCDDYVSAVTDEVEKLINASNGHAAVLFTSYKVMDKVWERMATKKPPYPFFRLDKGGVREIEKFKRSKNGVLFAAGALWEGIDIPGDALSMLIIVKLPFAVPDPISEYERSMYPDFGAYLDGVIVPEMLIKLKQGFGRLIRTERDTGVVALLDSRYREHVLNTLPPMSVTSNIEDARFFLAARKDPTYFSPTWE